MDKQEKSVNDSPGVPLFVLRYRRGGVFLRILGLSILSLVSLGSISFAAMTSSGVWLMLELLLFGSLFGFMLYLTFDLFDFDEIRLYRDRIVRVSRWTRQKEILLANAKYSMISGVTICNCDDSMLLGRFTGIFYTEELACKNDARMLNAMLAHAAGKTVAQFEQGNAGYSGKSLIESGQPLRVIDKEAAETELMRLDASSEGFNRTVTVALLFISFPLALAIVVLLYSRFAF